MQYQRVRLCVHAVGICIVAGLAGCKGGDGSDSQVIQQPVTVSGKVGDGPVANAAIEVADAFGRVVVQGASDDSAHYDAEIPAGTTYPLTVRATGGTDLVTNRAPDFTLETVVGNPRQTVANLSPISTFAAKTAACMAPVKHGSAIMQAWPKVLDQLSVGLDAARFGNPASTAINATNVAQTLLTSEGLGEVVRRARDALASTPEATAADDLVASIACDLAADGLIDGQGDGASPRAAATFWAADVAVLLEVLAGQLRVDGADATARLDGAMTTVMPGGASVATVAATDTLVRQARFAISVLQGALNDDVLARYSVALDTVSVAQLPSTVRQMLPADVNALSGLPPRVASADDSAVGAAMTAVDDVAAARMPLISFAASPAKVSPGTSARLSWASTGARNCVAAGAWSGTQPVEGSTSTAPLSSPARYRLDCTGPGGTASGEVLVGVAGVATPPRPTVSLSASAPSVSAGATVTLNWSSTDATSCAASGGWGGARPGAGSEVVGPLAVSSTFFLACSGAGGSAQATVNVSVAAAPPPPATPPPPPATPPPTPVTAVLTVSPAWVDLGKSAQLSWTSSAATACTASGGWSGAKATSGSSATGAMSADASYSLSCTGPGGNALSTASVSVRTARLSWQPPSGSLALAGFRIDYGQASGNYTQKIDLPDASARAYQVALPPGTYYFALTALNSGGIAQARSNEVSKTID